eukprot:307858-Lingulodinium_polyedra.AAC.1
MQRGHAPALHQVPARCPRACAAALLAPRACGPAAAGARRPPRAGGPRRRWRGACTSVRGAR